MEKTYDPHAIEQRWYQHWEARGFFRPSGHGRPYCIMIPPPNVTGSLHMGHAFQDTLMDTLIRYHRMDGDDTLWQPGTDHAGIATQMVVERQLAAEGKTRHDLGREAFIERVWQWKATSGGRITQQLRRMGCSLDWSRERFTMDEGLSKAVREVFVRLYEEGLIYRGKRLVNWDPTLQTAVSDLEVIAEEKQGKLWHIRYPLSDGSGHLVVATTRPETLLGDCAVAVHPEDERYRHLIGKTVRLPIIAGREIPIIADDYVDPEFGTGVVKITPAHDFNDYQVWQRHKDEPAIANQPFGGLINIFTPEAKLKSSPDHDFTYGHRASSSPESEEPDELDGLMGTPTYQLIPEPYRGLDRFDVRERLIKQLQNEGLLEKTEDHRLMVPRGDRSGDVIEPYLTDQWFVKIEPLAKPAIEAVETGRIRFVPDNWKNTYFEWMRNIQDWCISRQIWWGHRIPAWYDEHGNVYVGRSEAEVRLRHDLGPDTPLRQDEDVLDTWFSSALWPFSTLGWPDHTPELGRYYPTSVLVTGFDIIFFWVARMIMMGLKFMGDIPFQEVYIHGLVRDAHGQKMSKSKGNVLDPIDLIDGIDLESLVEKRTTGLMQPQMAEKIARQTRKEFPDGIPAYGTDALRFTFAALASTGRDINFDLGRIQGYRNFCNKIWNAARFVLMNLEGRDLQGERRYTLADRWIRTRLDQTIETVRAALDGYRFDHAAQALYDFIWHDYCDWYLELAKPALGPDSPEASQRATRATLVEVLDAALRLLHPIMPFITEEIWQRLRPHLGETPESIMLAPYPRVDEGRRDPKAVAEMGWVQAVISGVRRIRSTMNIPPGRPLPLLVQGGSPKEREWLAANGAFIIQLARLESITALEDDASPPESATELAGETKLLIPLAGLIDKDAELARLEREIGKLHKSLVQTEAKLANPRFIDKAPAAVVAKERTKLEELRRRLDTLKDERGRIQAL